MGLGRSEYCEACAPSVQKFLDERDALHDKVAKMWDQHIAALYKKHGEGMPDPWILE